TGPAFIGGNLRKVGRVLVPSHLYKVVYSPRQGAGAAYFIENVDTKAYEVLSIAQLEDRIGIDLLPSLTRQQKLRMLRLPKVNSKSNN
ncbi:MAG: DNA/RNA non-specific endonuclease, partial [Janthinobacterium lividum]|nr:DNA/RNA non-specific endonuclease [Janthinobacterium lividum]